MRSRTSSPSGRRRLVGLVGGAAVLTALTVAGPVTSASASTAPVRDKDVSAAGTNTASVTVTTTGSEVWLAKVSTDGPATSAVTGVTVKAGSTSWANKVQVSYRPVGNAPGYAGVFSTGSPLAAGTRTITATLPKSVGTYRVFLEVVTLSNASGLGAVTSDSVNGGCPNLALTSTAALSRAEFVFHDWDNAVTPLPWPATTSVSVVDQSDVDTVHGDTSWGMHMQDPFSTSGQLESTGASAPCGGHWNGAGLEVLPAP
jgi:hypothetical protein